MVSSGKLQDDILVGLRHEPHNFRSYPRSTPVNRRSEANRRVPIAQNSSAKYRLAKTSESEQVRSFYEKVSSIIDVSRTVQQIAICIGSQGV